MIFVFHFLINMFWFVELTCFLTWLLVFIGFFFFYFYARGPSSHPHLNQAPGRCSPRTSEAPQSSYPHSSHNPNAELKGPSFHTCLGSPSGLMPGLAREASMGHSHLDSLLIDAFRVLLNFKLAEKYQE